MNDKILDLIAEVHATIVQSDDPEVRQLYPHSQAMLVAAIKSVHPDLDVEELREAWQDNGFEPMSDTAAHLHRLRDWYTVPQT